MVYIGFSKQSHKLYARVLCKNFRHCAPVIGDGKNFLLYQFVHRNKIAVIPITRRDLSILHKFGWQFIEYRGNINSNIKNKPWTCVQFTKQVCNIKSVRIQTPYGLFRYLEKK